jgi:peptide/nickel transport system substrate-binding protein
MVTAACGGDDGADQAETVESAASVAPPESTATVDSTATEETDAPTTTEGEQPQEGGTLRFAAYAEILGLDPIVAIGFGTSGGNQQGAIYDTLVRYNADTQTFENRTAESVEANADFTEWTVKIRPGIKFTDGTPYDAAAVKFGMDRHRSGLPGAPSCEELWACPKSNASASAYMSLVDDIEVVDDLTVKFTLNKPWPSFQVALSLEAAMIPSPTAVKQCDPAAPAKDCAFNLNPVGAGPFMVAAPMAAGEPLKLVRNPDYWDGPVYLDGIEFVTASDAGGAQSLELLKSDAVDVAYLQDPTAIDQARQAGYEGLSTLTQGGQALLFNIGASLVCTAGEPAPACSGKPDGPVAVETITSDLRLRQAVAFAIDPAIIDQRATGGVGRPTNALFVDPFKWNPGLPGPELDLEKAKSLVEELKAEGWDGTLRFLTPTTPFASNVGLAVQAQLGAIGINVVLDARQGQGWQAAVTGSKDFQMTMWGLATTQDDSGVWQLRSALSTGQTGNRGVYSNPDMDTALEAALVAESDEEKVDAYAAIQEQFNADVPYVVYSVREEFRAYAPRVHGLISSHRYIVFFDDTWLEA